MRVSEAAIRVRGLRKRYGDREVVRGIDLEVRTGEIFGFLGPNGAGKTTTIEILEGYRSRDGGEVSVLGHDPARPTREWRSRIGLVLQECELNGLLTVRETLHMFSSFYPTPRPIGEVIELVGLQGRDDSRMGTLSGGQRRRADVAVALIGDPELIFLDEPTTGFDPTARREAWQTIAGLKEIGKTVLLTTHYMEEASFLSDRVSILRAGQIVAEGKPDELGETAAVQTRISFIGPDGIDVATIAAEAAVPVAVEGQRMELQTDDPQRVLLRLTTWADQAGVELGELEVLRPSLEDVFLELTGTAAQESSSTNPERAGTTSPSGAD
jgi:ABC-2 type transport system ATP-binding protein